MWSRAAHPGLRTASIKLSLVENRRRTFANATKSDFPLGWKHVCWPEDGHSSPVSNSPSECGVYVPTDVYEVCPRVCTEACRSKPSRPLPFFLHTQSLQSCSSSLLNASYTHLCSPPFCTIPYQTSHLDCSCGPPLGAGGPAHCPHRCQHDLSERQIRLNYYLRSLQSPPFQWF